MSWTRADIERKDWKNRKTNFAENERTPGKAGNSTLDTPRARSTPISRNPQPDYETPLLSAKRKIYLPVSPCPKPRMTQRDRWEERPAVIRYRSFCDSVRSEWPDGVPYPEAGAHIVFHIPMPKSWSKRRRADMAGRPHRGRKDGARAVDKDNLEKALQDALCEDDSHVWHSTTEKRWASAGYIEIYLDALRPVEDLVTELRQPTNHKTT